MSLGKVAGKSDEVTIGFSFFFFSQTVQQLARSPT